MGHKLLKWLIGTSITVGVPAGGYFGFIHDVNDKKITYNENYRIEDLLQDLFVDCLDNTKDQNKISIALLDSAMNSAIHNALKENAGSALIPQMYCEFNKGTYSFVIQLKSEGFITTGTKIKIITKLEEKIRSDFDNKSCFVFSFKDVKLGKIGSLQNIAIPILKNFVTEEQIQEAMGEYCHATVKLDKGEIVYPKDELAKDIKNMMNSLSDTDIPFKSLFQSFFENDLVHVDTESTNAFKLDIDCLRFTANEEYVEEYDLDLNNPSKNNGITLDLINENVELMLETNSNIGEQASNLFQYFLVGYDRCPMDVRSILDRLDFSCMGPLFDHKLYKGLNFFDYSLNGIVSDQIQALQEKDPSYFTESDEFTLFNVNEVAINNYLKTTDVLGFSFVLSKLDKSDPDILNKYKTSYISVDNFYCNVYNERTNFVLGLNFNGMETSLILPTKLDHEKSKVDFSGNKIILTYELEDMKFGDVQMNSDFTKDIMNILSTASGDAFGISVSNGKYYISFDFTEAVTSAVPLALDSILKGCDFSIDTKGNSKEDIGMISIKGRYSL